jgi:fructose-1,6-bisphosphatase/inositol monophosphatase family enzyme
VHLCCMQGAGGMITDWAGRPLRWQLAGGDVTASASQCPGEVLAAGDARTHEQVLQLLQWKYA